MSLYGFGCPSCDYRWETFAASDRPKASVCPNCGADGRRVFTTFAMPESFGHHMYPNRTPLSRRRPRKESEERRVWDAQKADGQTLHPAGKG